MTLKSNDMCLLPISDVFLANFEKNRMIAFFIQIHMLLFTLFYYIYYSANFIILIWIKNAVRSS